MILYHQPHEHFSYLGMTGYIGQGLLDNPISSCFNLKRKTFRNFLPLKVDADAGLAGIAVKMPDQGWNKSHIIQHTWAQVERHFPDLPDNVADRVLNLFKVRTLLTRCLLLSGFQHEL